MHNLIDVSLYGVSFSVKQCRKFGQDPEKTLNWLLGQGFSRFRLMSYWDEHEKSPGAYNFSELDKQVDLIRQAGGEITMCLGVRQPRWPEFHWPDWAWNSPKQWRDASLLAFVETVVERYKKEKSITSWQLENEALLTGFGEQIEIDRSRINNEYRLVKKLDPVRPVVMSTSAAWGIPLRAPIPDIVASSYYLIRWKDTRYTTTYHAAFIHRFRALLVRLIWRKPFFIHELQLEPWGPKDIWEMPHTQQDESMGTKQITKNLKAAQRTKLYPIDLWGGEWWYQRSTEGDESVMESVKSNLRN